MTLYCVRCIVDWQALGDEPLITRTESARGEAITIQDGQALCTAHFNTVRGHAADYRLVRVTDDPEIPGRTSSEHNHDRKDRKHDGRKDSDEATAPGDMA